MLEYFSKNTVVSLGAIDVESVVPFAVQRTLKGCSTVMSGNSVQLNKCGVYDVECDLCFEASVPADITFTLYVDGVAQPQTVRTVTIAAADTFVTTHLSTYISKLDNNCRCNACTSPTNVYLAVAASVADVDVDFRTTDIQVYKVV